MLQSWKKKRSKIVEYRTLNWPFCWQRYEGWKRWLRWCLHFHDVEVINQNYHLLWSVEWTILNWIVNFITIIVFVQLIWDLGVWWIGSRSRNAICPEGYWLKLAGGCGEPHVCYGVELIGSKMNMYSTERGYSLLHQAREIGKTWDIRWVEVKRGRRKRSWATVIPCLPVSRLAVTQGVKRFLSCASLLWGMKVLP